MAKIATIPGFQRQAGREYTLVPGTADTYAQVVSGVPRGDEVVVGGRAYRVVSDIAAPPLAIDPSVLGGGGTPTPGPVLAALTLSNASFVVGSAQNTVVGAISGKTAGSKVEFIPASLADTNKLTVSTDGLRLLVGSAASTVGTVSGYLRETLAGAQNTPRDTPISINVANVSGAFTANKTIAAARWGVPFTDTLTISNAAGPIVVENLPPGVTATVSGNTITFGGTPA